MHPINTTLKGLILSILFLPLSNGQSLYLQFPDIEVATDSNFQVALRAFDFNEIVSMQFSINWNPSIISYTGHEDGVLPSIAIGANDIHQGQLRVSWFDTEGIGQSLPDSSALIVLNFTAIGNAGDMTDLSITSTPLDIQIYTVGNTPGNFEEISLIPEHGSVQIIDENTILAQANAPLCYGNEDGNISIQLPLPANNYQIDWSGPNNFNASSANIEHLSAGEYAVEVLDLNGDLIYQNTFTLLAPNALNIDTIQTNLEDCTSSDGTAIIVANGGTSPYSYYIGVSENNNGNFSGLESGAYQLILTDAHQCILVDSFTIAAPNTPQISLPSPFGICGNNTDTLRLSENYYSILWSTGAQTQEIAISQEGTYYVTVSNELGCEASASTEAVIETDVLLEAIAEFPEICPGDSVQLIASGASSYIWSPNYHLSDPDIASPLAFPDSSLIYQIIGATACGADTLEVPVSVYTTTAKAANDTCIILGDAIPLHAYNGLSYFWESARWPVTNPTAPITNAFPLDSTTYYVQITDNNDCTTRDSINVLVIDDPLGGIKFINMITPNGDGKNDVLEFIGLEKFGDNNLQVYNRWGNLLFSKEQYQSDNELFDGTYKGEKLPAGTYYYVLKYRYGEIKQKLTVVY